MSEPIVGGIEGRPRDARRMILAFFATCLLAFAVVVRASIWSNHFGAFGDEGRFYTYNDRVAKADYLARQEPKDLARAWIIGSSNTMSFLSTSVEERFGLPTFNLGAFWGRVEDTWAWLNFLLRDLETRPGLLVLGVEPWSFSADDSGPPFYRRYRRRLLHAPELARHLDDYGPLKLQASNVLDTVSMQNYRIFAVMTMRKGFTRDFRHALEQSSFRLDGTQREYAERDPPDWLPREVNQLYAGLVDGSLDEADAAVAEQRRAWLERGLVSNDDIRSYLPGGGMSAQSLDLFSRTLALCDENGIEVGVVLLPVHPYFFDLLVRDTEHERHLEQLRAFLAEQQERHPALRAVFDASRLERFGGSPFEFHDRLHMTPDNTDKVLDGLRRSWEAGQ